MKSLIKNLILLAGGVVFIAGITFLVATDKNNEQANFSSYSSAMLEIMENDVDFGTVMMDGGKISYDFKIMNQGMEAVRINKILTSCMCTVAFLIDVSGKESGPFGMPGHSLSPQIDMEIKPGETVTIKAIFDPAAHGPSGVGLAQRSIYIETNSSQSPKLEIRFQAMVAK